MSFKWRIQAISNDCNRMSKETAEEFFPVPGLSLRGYAGNREIKINVVV
jgi:hypothetical protein